MLLMTGTAPEKTGFPTEKPSNNLSKTLPYPRRSSGLSFCITMASQTSSRSARSRWNASQAKGLNQ